MPGPLSCPTLPAPAIASHQWNPMEASWTGCPGDLVSRDQLPRDESGRWGQTENDQH